MTLPGHYDLAEARRWHLSTAWFLAIGTIFFGLWSILNGHLTRDLAPRWSELKREIYFTNAAIIFGGGRRMAQAAHTTYCKRWPISASPPDLSQH